MTAEPAAPRRSPVPLLALAAGVLAIVLVGAGGPLWRFGLAHFRTGFTLMRYGTYVGLAAIVLGLVAAALAARPGAARRGIVLGLVAVVLGGTAFYLPWDFRRQAQSVPPIHDITTDTENPPAFRAAVAVREADGATNPPAYAGDSVAALQREAYPDLRPVIVPVQPDSAFTAALAAVRELGWEVIDANGAEGRIEATETTGWWGFRDDVVVRVMPASGVARVDVRSKSRVGGSDIGANAARIRRFLAALQARTGTVDG